MSVGWSWILLGAAIAFLTKLSGYLLPARWLENPRMARVSGALTVGLLAALVAINAFAQGQRIVPDARLGALLAAALLLWLRLPFIVVVIGGAAAAALLRALGVA